MRAALLAAALLGAAPPAAAQAPERLLRAEMNRIAREMNATALPPWARHAQADLDGDGVRDRLALFTIEGMNGGNNYSFFLAVQLSASRWRPVVEGIGGKLMRQPDALRVEGRIIVVPMRVWTDADPGCCPTGEGVARFQVRNGRIVEIGGWLTHRPARSTPAGLR
jgi:hypothetical protein